MSFSNVFSGTQATKPVVLFDISSGSVGAALCTLEADETPTIYYATRVPIEFRRTPTFEELAAEMFKVLNVVVGDVASHIRSSQGIPGAIGHPKEAHCLFSSSWCSAHMKTLVASKEQPFVVTRRFIDHMLKDYEDQFRKATAKGNTEVAEDLMLLEQSVIDATLNGYPTSRPMGKRAARLELHLYVSFVSKKLSTQLSESIEESLGVSSVVPHSFLLAFFSAVRDMFIQSACAELAWSLSGKRNTEWLKKYTSIWKEFEDVSGIIEKSYGFRWRRR